MFSQENLAAKLFITPGDLSAISEIVKIGKVECFSLFNIFQFNEWNSNIRRQ